MADVRVDADEVRQYFGGMLARFRNKRPLLRRIGLFGVEITNQAFREGKDPETGAPWEALNRKYAAWKARKGYSRIPLTLKRRLRLSIHSVITKKNTVAWGTDTTYGVHHQEGTKTLPMRRFLGLSSSDLNEIHEIANRWIQGRKR